MIIAFNGKLLKNTEKGETLDLIGNTVLQWLFLDNQEDQ